MSTFSRPLCPHAKQNHAGADPHTQRHCIIVRATRGDDHGNDGFATVDPDEGDVGALNVGSAAIEVDIKLEAGTPG